MNTLVSIILPDAQLTPAVAAELETRMQWYLDEVVLAELTTQQLDTLDQTLASGDQAAARTFFKTHAPTVLEAAADAAVTLQRHYKVLLHT